jgi:hypothetical protein
MFLSIQEQLFYQVLRVPVKSLGGDVPNVFNPEAGVLKKLCLASLATLSRLRNS